MFGFRKSPGNKEAEQKSSRRTSSEPALNVPDSYKNDFANSGGLENQSVQELEHYAAFKAQETTSTVNNCLKIAEDIRGDATRTLDMLHQQGEQINRTHMMAADMDKDLHKGEKLLNNLGGMFSMPWKPKKGKEITGPVTVSDKPSKASKEQREKLGVAPAAKGKSGARTPRPEQSAAMQKVEAEKNKQDDALDDLSNILGDLKGMAAEMGSEIESQNKALDHLSDDVDGLSNRVKGANQRARKLLG
uniref:t-SNARE coiled-coil homology domain-containing protein n=1 Tax=Kalanchoe fedtschenkoi TaxID=63787 RepID=A0A7N0TSQ0_KALFE